MTQLTLPALALLVATAFLGADNERPADRIEPQPAARLTGHAPMPGAERSFISVAQLRTASLDSVTILDARSARDYNRGHLEGAVRISWLDYRDSWGRTGRLPDDLQQLGQELSELGISRNRAVVVYGDARDGWGEEGRIAWMLSYLGHTRVYVLDGGFAAWKASDGPFTRAASSVVPGHFAVEPKPLLRAEANDIARAGSRGALVLDTRSKEEFNGSRRYFPSRTGRIPGATHMEWSELLTAEGVLDRSSDAMRRLHQLGLARDREIIAYCVGGVRSAFVVQALRELGFRNVRNYDGSWYEWSADRTRPIEHP